MTNTAKVCYNYYVNLTFEFTLIKGDVAMYAILTENIELVKLAETQNAQVFDLGNSDSLAFSSLNSMSNRVCSQDPEKRIEQELFKLLTNLGVPAHLKGFKYISYGITLLLNDTSYENLEITKRLYPDIAKQFNTLPPRVEKNIRKAIEVVFKKGSNELIQEIFGVSFGINKERTTNSEFLIGIKNYLKIMCNL